MNPQRIHWLSHLPFGGQMKIRQLAMHVVPALLAVASFVLGAILFTLPIAAVFLIDGAFVVSDYVRFVEDMFLIGIGTVALLISPIALVLDLAYKKARPVILILPFLILFLLLAVAVFRKLALNHSLQDIREGWNGIGFLLSFLLVIYWTALLAEKSIAFLVERMRHRARMAKRAN